MWQSDLCLVMHLFMEKQWPFLTVIVLYLILYNYNPCIIICKVKCVEFLFFQTAALLWFKAQFTYCSHVAFQVKIKPFFSLLGDILGHWLQLFFIAKSIEQLMFPKHVAMLQSASWVRVQELIACCYCRVLCCCFELLFLHCEFAFAAPGLVSALSLSLSGWLTLDTGQIYLAVFHRNIWRGAFRSVFAFV